MLASLDGGLLLVLAHGALETQHDLLSCLRLLVEDGLGLPTVPRLLPVVTSLALCKQRCLASLVLSDFVWRVFAAVLALAERVASLWDVDHLKKRKGPTRWLRLDICAASETRSSSSSALQSAAASRATDNTTWC